MGEASTIIFWLLPFTAALLTKRDILENGFFFPHYLIVFSLISREKLNWKFHFPQTKSKSFEVFSDLCHYQQRSRIKDCGKCIFGFTGSYRSIIPYIKSIDTITMYSYDNSIILWFLLILAKILPEKSRSIPVLLAPDCIIKFWLVPINCNRLKK